MGISQVAEGKRLFFEQTVLDNLILGGFVRWRKHKEEVREDIEKICALFPVLGRKKPDLAGSLSGGEQQMLVIAQALMARPRLLMLDEPSLGLAPLIVEDIFQVIQELHQQDVTILLVEQRARQALEICNRGYILDTGRIVEKGSGDALRESPKLKQAYLGDGRTRSN
jgi:branched-chain amino acid transport system ATP-binding protein